MSATLLLIYGPTASGKLTTARAVQKLTGFPVFHNHMSHALVSQILPRSSPAYGDLDRRIRGAVLETCAAAGVSVIHTAAYAVPRGAPPSPITDQLRRWQEGLFNPVLRVQLRPRLEVIERRILDESRAQHGKLHGRSGLEVLRRQVEDADIYAKADPDDLSIDNSDLPAEDVARMIVDEFKLAEVPGGDRRP